MEGNNAEETKTVTYKTTTVNIPEKYKPISAWGYIGYQIVFSLPIIGLILLLVYAFGDGNVNVKNFARSNLIIILICLVLTIITLLIMAFLGVGLTSFVSNAKYY